MKAANDNPTPCPQCISPLTGGADKCVCSQAYQSTRIKQVYTCQNCGQEFNPKRTDRTKFCGRECSFAFYTAQAAVRAAEPKPPKPPKPKPRSNCVQCGVEFEHGGGGAKYCSERCGIVTRAANDNVDRTCAECGTVFSTTYGDKRRNYCSTDCQRRNTMRVKRLKRRARMRAVEYENVNPMVVFDRAGWRCYICGIDTPRELRGTIHLNAPELEHIVPLARGGTHTYANTACACRKCNAIKSDNLPNAA